MTSTQSIFDIANRLDYRSAWQDLFEKELFVSTGPSEIHDLVIIKQYYSEIRVHQKSSTSSSRYNTYNLDCGYNMRDRQLDISLHFIDGVGHSVVIQYNNILSNNFICAHTNLIDLKLQLEKPLEKIFYNRVSQEYGI
jgi:hypothetical protein